MSQDTKQKDKQIPEDFYENLKKVDSIKMRALFRFADRKEKTFMIFGTIAALLNGATLPCMSILFGDVSNDFNDTSDIIKTAGKYSISFLVLGIISFICSYMSFGFWMIAGESQGLKYRKAYFKSLVRQEIAFYDAINPNEIASRVANECFEIQQGMGDKVSTYFFALSMTLVGFLIGYIKGWQLALVLTASVPCMAIAGAAFVMAFQKVQRVKNEAYAEAGAVAEECLNAIRTVTALGGHLKEHKRYHELLVIAKNKIIGFILKAGLAMGMMNFFTTATWALGFYFGSKLVENQTTNDFTGKPYVTGDVFTVFFAILMGSSSIGQLAPCMKAFASAKEAAARAFKIIDKKSLIDINDQSGVKPAKIEGEFAFDSVEFAYPLKKEKLVLKGVTFTIKKNQKTAFVGESGCGKTTSMQLIERFYDITGGSLKLDGVELRDLNLLWLRSNMGYVGQEPVLFATSIRENMLFAKENASDDEIWDALKKANAIDFVKQLPKGLDTYVGMSGTQLSGGQKQRLAIARAILKNPPILLLDEATSALDRKNEREIQQTLDEISSGRTTIVIAHRLSTIQNADHIIVFDQGVIVEQGKHEELIAKKGRYYELQRIQLIQQQQADETDKKNVDNVSPTEVEAKVEAKEKPQSLNHVAVKVEDSTVQKASSSSNMPATGTVAGKGKKPKPSRKEISGTMRRLFRYNKGERWPFFVAVFASIVNGALFPFMSIYMSNLLGILSFPNASNFRSEANRFCLYFFINACIALVAQLCSVAGYSYNGETLTLKLRSDLFKKLLKMSIPWYDNPDNTPGGLTTKLSTDCIQINRLAGSSLGIAVGAISTLVTGLIIAFVSSWQITLCTIAFLPILIFAGKMQGKVAQGFSAQTDEAYKDSGAFIAETVVNMRTVASFGKEELLLKNFEDKLKGPVSLAIKHGSQSGLAYGFAQFTTFVKYAYVFIIGAAFMNTGDVDYVNMFKSIFAIMFSAMGIGQAFQYLPDIGEAQNSAIALFKMLDYKPEIDLDDPSQTEKKIIIGEIEFKNVYFKYPTREKYVLNDFNLKINTHSKVAFVGPSGCGKSTIIGLLLRFYDPERGQILVDGIDIKKYDLLHLRRSFGFVSQEPTLFNCTIEDNIKYTKPTADDSEIRRAAEEANCLKFIESNEFEALDLDPEAAKKFGTGFKRMVGPKGSQISGGQKQRIAIARSILNKPNVLLLDEATSALDAENEKIVQASLDKIMAEKTSIIVAHRISTIKDAHQILVFNNGMVVEKGSYDELTTKQGFFYKLERGIAL